MIEQDLERRRVLPAREVLEGARDEALDAALEREPLDRHLGEARGEAVERVLDDGDQDAVLVAELVLHRAPGDAGAARYLDGGRAFEADLRDARDDRGGHAGAGLGGALRVRAARAVASGSRLLRCVAFPHGPELEARGRRHPRDLRDRRFLGRGRVVVDRDLPVADRLPVLGIARRAVDGKALRLGIHRLHGRVEGGVLDVMAHRDDARLAPRLDVGEGAAVVEPEVALLVVDHFVVHVHVLVREPGIHLQRLEDRRDVVARRPSSPCGCAACRPADAPRHSSIASSSIACAPKRCRIAGMIAAVEQMGREHELAAERHERFLREVLEPAGPALKGPL